MPEANKTSDIQAVSAKNYVNNQQAVVISKDKQIKAVIAQPNSENVIDIGNLFDEGYGIKINNRMISADTTVLVSKSDLTEYLSEKADKAESLSGYGILDGITYEIIEDDEEEEEVVE